MSRRSTPERIDEARRDATREALTHWFLGLLVGGIAGIAPLALGTLGLVLALPVVLWASVDRPRGVALGGALVGVGAAWFVVWGRAILSCAGPDTATDGCVGQDLSGLIAVPILVLVIGGLTSFVTGMRLARSQTPGTEPPSIGEDG
jgi:hypothetical protein